MRGRRSTVLLVAAIVLAAIVLVVSSAPPVGASRQGSVPDDPTGRVLVFSLPAISWADLERAEVPHLDGFLDEAAIADLSVRVVTDRTSPTDGYATIGAGTRAAGSGAALAAYEAGGVGEAAHQEEEFTRRTGVIPAPGEIFNPGVIQVTAANERLDFGAEIGALGDALDDAGVPHAVVANADHVVLGKVEPLRSATLALMGADGIVPAGRVGPALLQQDTMAPYGVRYDLDEVEAAFTDAWSEGGVVLVEAGDVARFDAYRSLASASQRPILRQEALTTTDALFGRLLREVDPTRDSVLVVGPYHRGGEPHLTIAAMQSPGMEPGLLRSGTTRRTGFVTLVDVAPTILELVDVARPESMEGRPFERAGAGGSAADRREHLIEADRMARFRDDHVTPASVWYVIGNLLLWVLAAASLKWGTRRQGRLVEVLALAGIGFLPATYLARLLPFHDWGDTWWWCFVGLVSVGYGAVSWFCGRRNPVDSLIVALAGVVVLLALDVLTGARLQLNSVFGYSPTIAGRFAGFGNLAFAHLGASALMLAALVAHRVGGRRGIGAALAILIGVIVIDGAPIWGSDVGGVLALVPATGVTIWLLLGRRPRWREVLGWSALAVVTVLAFGLLDLTRPEDSRTHLGRLLEDIAAGGFEPFRDVVVRKLDANLSVLTSNVWTLMVPVVFAFVGYLYWRAPGALKRVSEEIPAERAALGGLAVAMFLGFALNDSGIAVPGVMLGVVNASLVFLLLRINEDLRDANEVAGPMATAADAASEPGLPTPIPG